MDHKNRANDIFKILTRHNPFIDSIRESQDEEFILIQLNSYVDEIKDNSDDNRPQIINNIYQLEIIFSNQLTALHYAVFVDWKEKNYPDLEKEVFQLELEPFLKKREEEILAWYENLVSTKSDLKYILSQKVDEIGINLKIDIGEPEYIIGSKYWLRLIHIKELEIYEQLLAKHSILDDNSTEQNILDGVDLNTIAEQVYLLYRLGFYDAIKKNIENKFNNPSIHLLAEITAKVLKANKTTIYPCLNAILNDNRDNKNYPKNTASADVILRKLNPD